MDPVTSDLSEFEQFQQFYETSMSREEFDALSHKDKEAVRAHHDTDELLNALCETLCPWVIKYQAAGADALTKIIGRWIAAWLDPSL